MGNLSKRMVPFFVVLLLGSVLMVPLPVIRAEPEPMLIAGNELVTYPEPDWSVFWSKFNQYSQWDLEYYNGAQWVSCKSDLQIVRDYPTPNQVKLTLVFDASHNANYRLTFAIDERVKTYAQKLDSYQYELNYENYSMIWDWSDAVAIPNLVFTHGLLNNMFWFRMRRDSVPLGAHVVIDPSLIVSYPTTNQDDEKLMSDTHPSAGETSAVGQSFQNRAVDTNITSVKFYLRDTAGTADGNVVAALYGHAGVYGASSLPSGAVLATSNPIACNTLGVGFALYEFTFPVGQRYRMVANTYYTIFVYRTSTAGTVRVGTDSSAPGHGGNYFYYNAGAWVADNGIDTIFYLYGNTEPTVDSYDCDTLFDAMGQYWFNVTVSDVDLVADLALVELNVTVGGNNTLILRWTQATDVFNEVSDPDAVCTLNTTVSTRRNIDADTDEICFLFGISTGATEGDCDVEVTATDDYGAIDIELYVSAFVFSVFDWNPVADLINAAFALFGIADFMGQMTVYIGGLVTYFATSLANIVNLIVLQFTFITLVFTTFLYWLTELLGTVVDFVTFCQDLMNGVSAWYNELGNLWDWIGWNTLSQGVPLFLLIGWVISMDNRARNTPGGEVQVFVNDIQTAANLVSYFLGVFSFVANTIIDRVYGLIQGII